MQDQTDRMLEAAGETITYAQTFLKDQKDLFKIEIAERTAKVSSTLLTNIIVGAVLGIVILFISLAAALAIGLWLNNAALGFLAVAGIYLLSLGILFAFKTQWLTKPILSRIIQDFYD